MKNKFVLWILTLVFLISAITSVDYLVSRTQRVFELEVIESEEGWGYQILRRGKLLIRQDHIPGIADKRPFKTREDAERVGHLVIQRLDQGKSPRVSKKDLNENGIAYQY